VLSDAVGLSLWNIMLAPMAPRISNTIAPEKIHIMRCSRRSFSSLLSSGRFWSDMACS